METYRHSGVISPAGVLMAATVGIPSAIVLGALYSCFMVYSPFVRLNVLLAFVLGAGIGYSVGWSAKVGKIRNPFVATAYGVTVGLIGLYVAWGTDYVVRVFLPEGYTDYWMAYSPTELWDYIQWFYENGMWSAGRGGKPVTGVELGCIWLSEAAMIVGTSALYARRFALNKPFCEYCKCWTVAKPGQRALRVRGMDDYLRRLFDGDLTALKSFHLAENDDLVMKLDLATCPNCDKSNYLTIQKVMIAPDKEGNPTETATPIVQNMLISSEFVPLVQTAGIGVSREWKR